ncbi:hypothetical protein RHSIM_Rhsim13G0037800 [Rhododendron simsii]|uniref:Ubiquitin-like domain-containing protein n=1 Tax=Rhododendron simsii TaxID=118357 RepID=A0A834G247_RHOSS|nr:hypothetical protein RHSIM_Rhsim13G0037800 [Rhododendron simsii]
MKVNIGLLPPPRDIAPSGFRQPMDDHKDISGINCKEKGISRSTSMDSSSSSLSSSTLTLRIKIPCQNKTLVILQESSDSISDVKTAITFHVRKPGKALLLIYDGQPLADEDKQLADYNVEDCSTIYSLVNPFESGYSSTDHGPRLTIALRIRRPDWKTSVIDFVEPWFTVRDVKMVIESSSGLPLERITLSHCGKILDDAASPWTLRNGRFDVESPFYVLMEVCEPSDDYVLMEERELSDGVKDEFQIVLRDCDQVLCEEYSISVSALETVLDVKNKIGKALGIHPARQFLFRGKNTPQLDDEKTLRSYGLKDKSVVWLLGSFLKLYIKVPQASRMLELKVYGDYVSDDIKRMIFEKTGIPISSQSLVYGTRPLDNLKTLESYNIVRNSIIYAIVGVDKDRRRNSRIDDGVGVDCEGRMHFKQVLLVSFELSPRHILIIVKPWYTIFDVKALIESASGILIRHQNLMYRDEMLEDDWNTIEQCGILPGYPLFMKIRRVTSQIYLTFCNKKAEKEENKTIGIEAKSFENVDDIMSCIPIEQIEKLNGQLCLFLDEASQCGNKLLAQYEMESGLILSLDRLIQINVRDVHGDLTEVGLKPWYSIDKVKIKVEERCGIPRELQMLTYKEEELDDTMTLGDCEELFGSLWNLRWNCGGDAWSFFWPSYDGSGCSKNIGDKKWPREIKDFHGYL